jgi:hypothetical protein
MFDLMDRHYENVRPEAFHADLAEKEWVILLCDRATEALCGFSTQMLLDVDVAGRPVKALFSGDTIIARDHWGDQALASVWGRFALSLMDAHAQTELYWFLLSKGYKTYRFLPVFFTEFYPRPNMPTPGWAREIIDALGQCRYPGVYSRSTGIVRATPRKDRLRSGIADLTDGRLRNPYVRFFAERNPGHIHGDELCCLAPLTRNNFTAAAYRVIDAQPSDIEIAA